MRWLSSLLAVAVVVASTPEARGKPRLREVDFTAMELDAPEPCERGKTWSRVRACLDKHARVTILHDTDTVKLVGLGARTGRPATQLVLYAHRDAAWTRTNLFTSLGDNAELLAIAPYPTPHGNGLRVDIGHTSRTSVSVDQATTSRSVLRRVNTTVCSPTAWTCQTVMTACDAYVRGKPYYTFRAEIVWHATLGLRLRGDTTNAGVTCRPSPSWILADEATP